MRDIEVEHALATSWEGRFVDSAGFTWTVRALPPSHRKEERADHLSRLRLYFFSRRGTRRLDAAPADLERLSRRDLSRLCDEATPLQASFGD